MSYPGRLWAIEIWRGRNNRRNKWGVAETNSLRPAVFFTRDEARRCLYSGECGNYPKGYLRIRQWVAAK